jgi:hypothetical protein
MYEGSNATEDRRVDRLTSFGMPVSTRTQHGRSGKGNKFKQEAEGVQAHMHHSIRGILAGSEKLSRASGLSFSAWIGTHAQTKTRSRQSQSHLLVVRQNMDGQRHEPGKSRTKVESDGVSGFRLEQGNTGKCFEKADMTHMTNGTRTYDPPAQGQDR